MSRGTNLVVVIGHAGADAELRNGAAAVSLATNEGWKDKATGELKERAEWHRLKFFGRLAEVATEYIVTGTQLYARGRLHTDRYTDREGVERYSTEIIVEEFNLLGGARRESEHDASTDR